MPFFPSRLLWRHRRKTTPLKPGCRSRLYIFRRPLWPPCRTDLTRGIEFKVSLVTAHPHTRIGHQGHSLSVYVQKLISVWVYYVNPGVLCVQYRLQRLHALSHPVLCPLLEQKRAQYLRYERECVYLTLGPKPFYLAVVEPDILPLELAVVLYRALEHRLYPLWLKHCVLCLIERRYVPAVEDAVFVEVVLVVYQVVI